MVKMMMMTMMMIKKGRKYFIDQRTQNIESYMATDINLMVKYHSDNERGNPLSLSRGLQIIFYVHIAQTG